ncbi:hypothetical protein [Pseudomonas triclosanedens]|uniref:Uncharacterized protein n=1 Tax=Pseudomonas triclosanedens TaxID=2961893 RepID=A0ABY6ZUF7_9PSED|nr:hypothetical protein [Pseudomonas triclosanedens]WAI47628.1 hypothetical protein OU419_17800 [Pseudomonas triclosanedens]
MSKAERLCRKTGGQGAGRVRRNCIREGKRESATLPEGIDGLMNADSERLA